MQLATRHGARNVGMFGSVARGENLETSDVDVLAEFDEGRTLFDLIAFRLDLCDPLGTNVDVVTPGSLRRIRESVFADARINLEMPRHSPFVYLLHMRDACERLLECAALRDDGTTPSYILLDAVCRNLEVLGEASRKVGPEFRADHPKYRGAGGTISAMC